jgi:hypothetical protein
VRESCDFLLFSSPAVYESYGLLIVDDSRCHESILLIIQCPIHAPHMQTRKHSHIVSHTYTHTLTNTHAHTHSHPHTHAGIGGPLNTQGQGGPRRGGVADRSLLRPVPACVVQQTILEVRTMHGRHGLFCLTCMRTFYRGGGEEVQSACEASPSAALRTVWCCCFS